MYILWNFSTGRKAKNSVNTHPSNSLSTMDHKLTDVWSKVGLCDHRDKPPLSIAERNLLKCNTNTSEEISFMLLVSTNITAGRFRDSEKNHMYNKVHIILLFLQAQEVLQCHFSVLWDLKIYTDKVLEPATRYKHKFKLNVTQYKGCITI